MVGLPWKSEPCDCLEIGLGQIYASIRIRLSKFHRFWGRNKNVVSPLFYSISFGMGQFGGLELHLHQIYCEVHLKQGNCAELDFTFRKIISHLILLIFHFFNFDIEHYIFTIQTSETILHNKRSLDIPHSYLANFGPFWTVVLWPENQWTGHKEHLLRSAKQAIWI